MPGVRRQSKLSVGTNRAPSRHWLEASGPTNIHEDDLLEFKHARDWSPSPSPTGTRNLATNHVMGTSRTRPITSLLRKIRARSTSNGSRGRGRYRRRNRSIEPLSSSSGMAEEESECIEMSHIGGIDLKQKSKVKDQGHKFMCVTLRGGPTWCDHCGRPLLGVMTQFVICRQCSYTCHQDCRRLVNLFCPQALDRLTRSKLRPRGCGLTVETSLIESITQDKDIDAHADGRGEQAAEGVGEEWRGVCDLEREELEVKVNEFNCNNQGLLIELMDDKADASCRFIGHIRVYINLYRPITMCLSATPPSLLDAATNGSAHSNNPEPCNSLTTPTDSIAQSTDIIAQENGMIDRSRRGIIDYTARMTSSFYLPPNTSKLLHITDKTTVLEVIQILLSKFKITDNPRKFALYEKYSQPNLTSPCLRRMQDSELPLVQVLYWSSRRDSLSGLSALQSHSFVLQENDSAEISWESFSVHELEAFLAVLQREQEEYISKLKARYRLLRILMNKRAALLAPEGVATAV